MPEEVTGLAAHGSLETVEASTTLFTSLLYYQDSRACNDFIAGKHCCQVVGPGLSAQEHPFYGPINLMRVPAVYSTASTFLRLQAF